MSRIPALCWCSVPSKNSLWACGAEQLLAAELLVLAQDARRMGFGASKELAAGAPALL
jgi:hypothetical protein